MKNLLQNKDLQDLSNSQVMKFNMLMKQKT